MIVDNQIRLNFSQDDAQDAWDSWGCNCGPSALAACLGMTLKDVYAAVASVGFPPKNYMSPTMMQGALRHLGVHWKPIGTGNPIAELNFPKRGLVRIQWEGPWTAQGANPRWSYRHTHWIAAWRQRGENVAASVLAVLDPVVFDINGGLMQFDEWEESIVPTITKTIPRADGDWHVTHSWECVGVTNPRTGRE